MDFVETLTLQMPEVSDDLVAVRESAGAQGLVIEVSAIHEGTTANHNFYGGTELAASLPSWTSPYARPVLLHHDPYSEALGRVIGARMEKEEADGTPYVRIQVAVTDPEAIQKIRDQRYLTGSVGGKAGEATCSICGKDWAKASMWGPAPCKHNRGESYKGKLATLEMKNIEWKEWSFVNMPADARSAVRSINQGESDNFQPARFFCLDLTKESVVELGESRRDVLANLRPEDASPLYLGLKGAFLSALAEENRDKETAMDPADTSVEEKEVEEDILDVTDALTADLAPADEDEATEETEEVAEEDATEDTETAEVEETEEKEENQDEAVEETAESDETPEPEPEVAETEGEEEEVVEPATGTEGNEARVAELEARQAELLDENARLRTALKRNLVERVVDTKIAMGQHEAAERDELITEHLTRSASSLADSLRDLAKMPTSRRTSATAPVVESTSAAVTEDGSVVEGDGSEDSQSPQTPDPEDVFVDALMGRRSL